MRDTRGLFPGVGHVRELARLAVEREEALLVAGRRRDGVGSPGSVRDLRMDDLFDEALLDRFVGRPADRGGGVRARAAAEHLQPAVSERAEGSGLEFPCIDRNKSACDRLAIAVRVSSGMKVSSLRVYTISAPSF